MNTVALPKIAVVGTGNTAASLVYTLLLTGVHCQVLLAGPDITDAEEQALELQQAAVFFHPQEVRAAAISELSQASITVFCGVRRRPGEDADTLLHRNLELLREITLHIKGRNPGAIILLGAPSVEALTYAAWKFSELPRAQVIGTGTIAQTATLRYLLGRHFNVDAHSVHAYVLGGNGDRVPVWSSATIAGMYIQDVCMAHGCPPAVLQSIFNEVRDRTANMDAHPDAASLSTAAGLARLTTAILSNENHVFSVATVLDHEFGMNDTVISVPVVIGAKGIDRILRVELNDAEVGRLLACGENTRRAMASLDVSPRRFAFSEVC